MSRRLDLSLFQGDDSEDDDLPVSKSSIALNDQKAKTFSYGVTKKTKRDLEKEAEEKKKQEEDHATQLALQEFSQAFASPGNHAPGGSGGRSRSRGFVRAGEKSVYNPLNRRPSDIEAQPRSNAVFQRSPSPPPVVKRKGKRAMDAFLEEIKSKQEAREERFAQIAYREGTSITSLEAHRGLERRSFERETTNLFVVNLPSGVSEDRLGHLFASAGPVGTVKIMWPRGDEDHAATYSYRPKSSLTGFVSFMERADAERALRNFDDFEWDGSVLRVSWSTKPVPIPRRPAYEATSRDDDRPTKKSRIHGASRSSSPLTDSQNPEIMLYWVEQVSPHQSKFIQTVANKIKVEGKGFAKLLAESESDNPEYRFLSDQDKSPEYHVFQYCLDENYRFPVPPPPHFEDEGSMSAYSTDSAEESEKLQSASRSHLGRLARHRFEAMLRSMSGKRVEIARAMEFSLKRAEAADEITGLICESLRIDSTPIPRKMARLHLISDILHNSASPLPNVWKFRQAFEKQLSTIFAHFADVYDRLLVYSGSIAAEVFRQQVDAVLTIWERWIIFTADVHKSLRQLLHKQTTLESLAAGTSDAITTDKDGLDAHQPAFKSAGFKTSFKRIGMEDHTIRVATGTQAEHASGKLLADSSVGRDGENLDGEALDGEGLDGEELDGEGHDGEELDGEALDGEALDDEELDGETLDGEPFDGVATPEVLEEDVDGEIM